MGYQAVRALSGTLDTIATTVEAAAKVIEDPALPQIACHVLRLHRIARSGDPGPACPPLMLTDVQKQRGIGLYLVDPLLRGAVWARQNPAAAVGIVTGVVGLIGYVGYRIGRP